MILSTFWLVALLHGAHATPIPAGVNCPALSAIRPSAERPLREWTFAEILKYQSLFLHQMFMNAGINPNEFEFNPPAIAPMPDEVLKLGDESPFAFHAQMNTIYIREAAFNEIRKVNPDAGIAGIGHELGHWTYIQYSIKQGEETGWRDQLEEFGHHLPPAEQRRFLLAKQVEIRKKMVSTKVIEQSIFLASFSEEAYNLFIKQLSATIDAIKVVYGDEKAQAYASELDLIFQLFRNQKAGFKMGSIEHPVEMLFIEWRYLSGLVLLAEKIRAPEQMWLEHDRTNTDVTTALASLNDRKKSIMFFIEAKAELLREIQETGLTSAVILENLKNHKVPTTGSFVETALSEVYADILAGQFLDRSQNIGPLIQSMMSSEPNSFVSKIMAKLGAWNIRNCRLPVWLKSTSDPHDAMSELTPFFIRLAHRFKLSNQELRQVLNESIYESLYGPGNFVAKGPRSVFEQTSRSYLKQVMADIRTRASTKARILSQ